MTLDELLANARKLGFADQESIRKLARGTVVLQPQEASDEANFGSRLGGLPNLPPSVQWPQRDGRSLAFIAQVELASGQLNKTSFKQLTAEKGPHQFIKGFPIRG
jgi:hypothetical protein